MYLRIPVPRLPAWAGSNLLGVAGLSAIVAAVAALTSWKWGLLTGGVFAVGLAWLAQRQHEQAPPAAAAGPAAVPRSRIEAEAERILTDARRQLDQARSEATGAG